MDSLVSLFLGIIAFPYSSRVKLHPKAHQYYGKRFHKISSFAYEIPNCKILPNENVDLFILWFCAALKPFLYYFWILLSLFYPIVKKFSSCIVKKFKSMVQSYLLYFIFRDEDSRRSTSPLQVWLMIQYSHLSTLTSNLSRENCQTLVKVLCSSKWKLKGMKINPIKMLASWHQRFLELWA